MTTHSSDAQQCLRDLAAMERPVVELGPGPEVDQMGNTINEPGGDPGAEAYLNYMESSGTHTERWVLFDKDHFTDARVFRIRKTADSAWQANWSVVKPLINTADVEGFIEMVFTYLVPPASAADTGETGTFNTFELKNQKTGTTPYVCGCLVRIKHTDGTWTDHWALFDNYQPPDGTWAVQGTPQTASDTWHFTTVGDFYTAMLADPGWAHDPRKGWHVWVKNYKILASIP